MQKNSRTSEGPDSQCYHKTHTTTAYDHQKKTRLFLSFIIHYTQTTFISLPRGDKCAPITCVQNVPVQSHVSTLAYILMHIPRMWYYRRWHKRGQSVPQMLDTPGRGTSCAPISRSFCGALVVGIPPSTPWLKIPCGSYSYGYPAVETQTSQTPISVLAPWWHWTNTHLGSPNNFFHHKELMSTHPKIQHKYSESVVGNRSKKWVALHQIIAQ